MFAVGIANDSKNDGIERVILIDKYVLYYKPSNVSNFGQDSWINKEVLLKNRVIKSTKIEK